MLLTRNRLALATWFALLTLSALTFRRERKREPAFTAPTETAVSYSNILAADDERYAYADKTEAQTGAPPTQDTAAGAEGEHEVGSYEMPPPRGYAYAGAGSQMERPSVDAYGAFDGDMPGHREEQQRLQGPSRTMQMAYSDPCELSNPKDEAVGR
jgi:hypothetical protein